MKVFVCHRSHDKQNADKLLIKLVKDSNYSIVILREYEHDDNWKKNVEKKIEDVDFVLFLLGADTFESIQVKWEYSKAKELNKRIVALELPSVSSESVLFCDGVQVFKKTVSCWEFIKETFSLDWQLKIEQYKIMVHSTEKVTEQRLKVNNIFFTVTSSMLSIAFILGKAFEFDIAGMIGTLVLTLMAYLVTFFWSKLINSYGTLNKGKFQIIDIIEKQLRTNMFEKEWDVLEKIGYEPNSQTEINVIRRFRLFIILISAFELTYLTTQLYSKL